MKKLNQAFMNWMEHQLKEQPLASWKDAVQVERHIYVL
jgi:hypothetical protein